MQWTSCTKDLWWNLVSNLQPFTRDLIIRLLGAGNFQGILVSLKFNKISKI
ncbi:unnamed protein product, partial [Larinioides sclopetarius]